MERRYDLETERLMKQIELTDFRNPEENVTLCGRLLSIGRKRNDDYLSGYGYYYLDTAYFLSGKMNEVVKNHPKELKLLSASGQYDKLIRSHSTFGLLAAARNNAALALDCYINALSLASQHHLPYLSGLIYHRIGDLYKALGEYKTAVRCYRRMEKLCRRDTSQPYYHSNEILLHVSLCFCRCKQKDSALAGELLQFLETKDGKTEDRYHEIALLCVKFCYYHTFGPSSERDALIERILDAFRDCEQIFDFYTYLWDFCSTLLELEYNEPLLRCIHIFEEKLTRYEDSLPFLSQQLLTYKIHCYQRQGQSEPYFDALRDYYKMKEKQIRVSNEFAKSIIEYRFRMEDLKEKQETVRKRIRVLKSKSERDALTGLYNYSYIRNHLDHTFDSAVRNHTRLGVIILDIDFFKEYNDTYGHQAGDSAILTVAELLHSLESDRICCARYGGDEFILVLSDLTDGEILSVCRHIQGFLKEKRLPHAGNPCGSYFSVSQGARNSVPVPLNKSWDYLYAADMALYDIKKMHRGGIHLVSLYAPFENRPG